MVCYKITMVKYRRDGLLWYWKQSALNSVSLLWFKRSYGELKLSEVNLGTGQVMIDLWFYFDLNNKKSNKNNL